MRAELQELVDMKAAYQKEIQAKGEDAIKGVFSDLFDTHAGLESIEIRGYVPYFNDGDACEFSMYDPDVTYKGKEHDGKWGVEYAFKKGEVTAEDKTSLDAIFDSMSDLYKLEDAFQEVFGEHFRVTATREGVEVEEYTDHD